MVSFILCRYFVENFHTWSLARHGGLDRHLKQRICMKNATQTETRAPQHCTWNLCSGCGQKVVWVESKIILPEPAIWIQKGTFGSFWSCSHRYSQVWTLLVAYLSSNDHHNRICWQISLKLARFLGSPALYPLKNHVNQAYGSGSGMHLAGKLHRNNYQAA